MLRSKILIGGKKIAAASGKWLPSLDPYRNENWCEIPHSGPQDVDAAVAAAKTAFQSSRLEGPVGDRPRRAASQGRRPDRRDVRRRLAELEVRDNGKLINEMLVQLKTIPQWYYYYGGLADKVEGGVLPIDKPDHFVFTTWEPLGVGGRVDVSMLDAMASLLTFNAGMYFASGESPKRRGNVHPTISPYETFEASDGWFNLGVANDKFWSLFCGAVGRKDIETDPRFDAAPKRAANRAALAGILHPIFKAEPRDRWLEIFSQAGIPCGAIRTVGEVCEAPQLVERDMVQTVTHRVAGEVKFVARPLRFDGKPPAPSTPPPTLGEHTVEVFENWLEWTRTEVLDFASKGAFGDLALKQSAE